MKTTALWVAGLLLVGAASSAAAAGPMTAHATLKNAEGKTVGEVTLQQGPHGVLVSADLSGLPPGTHAFHIHETGKCEPPFKSAGGHLNPGKKQHGFINPKGMHAGDLPNIHVPDSGSLKVEYFDTGLRFGKIFDKDGSAIVIHAGADDYKSDPAGDAGERIACGVVQK